MKSSNIGGQAVMEGVMMKNGDKYAVAVRKENQEIVVKTEDYSSFIKNRKVLSLPVIRGVFNFIDSLVLGMKTLTYSASFFMEEEETEQESKKREKKPVDKAKQEKRDSMLMGITVAFSVVLAVGLL